MKCKIVIFMLIFVLGFQSYTCASVYKIYTLPELIHDSPHILLGIVQIENQKPVITIDKDFKGNLAGKYEIELTPAPFLKPPEFIDNGRVILFVSEPKEETIHLTGVGGQAKWPKLKKEHDYDEIYAEASLDEVADLIIEGIALQKTEDLDAQVVKIQNLLASSSRLAQVVGIQTINTLKYAANKKKREASKVSSVYVLPLLMSSEWIIRIEAVQEAANLPTSVLGDQLLEMITDPHFGVRKKAFAILSSRMKISNEYDPSWPAERLSIGKENLKKLWKSEKQAVLDQEVPTLIDQLQSDEIGSRKYAIQNLKVLFNEDFGYKPQDSRDKRKVASEKWKQWWNKQ